ncbi:MAG TPA: hypothetical protein VGM88_13175 [Kofleriaceae bacterium]|jgi:hypothetical protein
MKALLVVPALLAIGGGALVYADISKNTPGAVCVATSGALTVTNNGGAGNASTTTSATALCSIDRDIAPTVTTSVSATVWAIDQHPSTSLCCTLYTAYNGSTIAGDHVCLSGASSSVRTISLNTSTPLVAPGTFWTFFVSCTVPPTSAGAQSSIAAYRGVLQ